MESNFSVVVGTHSGRHRNQWKERVELAKTIEDNGYRVETTNEPWPRDKYVFSDGDYLIKRTLKGLYQRVGEGGFFQFGKDFVLVPDRFLYMRPPLRRLSDYRRPDGAKVKRKDITDAKNIVQKLHPEKRIYVVPTGLDPTGKAMAYEFPGWMLHLDMTCLVTEDYLFLDNSFYNTDYTKGAKKKFKKIAKEEDLEFILYNPRSDVGYNYFPLNCLILPSNGGELLVANKRARSFTNLLTKLGVDFVEADMDRTPRDSKGSIRCCTNIKDDTLGLSYLMWGR